MTNIYIKQKMRLLFVFIFISSIFLLIGCSDSNLINNNSANELKENQNEEIETPVATKSPASEVNIAIENNEGIVLNKILEYDDVDIIIENAVWEDDELAITYTTSTINYSGEIIKIKME